MYIKGRGIRRDPKKENNSMKKDEALKKMRVGSACLFANPRKHYAWFSGQVIPTTISQMRNFKNLDLLGKREVVFFDELLFSVYGKNPEFSLTKSKSWARLLFPFDDVRKALKVVLKNETLSQFIEKANESEWWK